MAFLQLEDEIIIFEMACLGIDLNQCQAEFNK